MPKLLDVPEDILVFIVGQLDFWSIVACEISTRSIHHLVQSDARLAYTKEALRSGRTPICSEPAQDLLASLRRHAERWRNLTSAFTSSPIDVHCGESRATDTSVVITDRYIIWSEWPFSTSMSRYDMISGSLESPWPTHTLSQGDVHATNPGQDLFVWIHDQGNSFSVRCLSLSTGGLHERAGIDEIMFEKDPLDYLEVDKTPRLSKDFLLFYAVADEHSVLYILSWKNADRHPTPQRLFGCSSATFLSNDTLVYNVGPMIELAKLSIKTNVPSGGDEEVNIQVQRIARMRLPDDLLPSPADVFHTIAISPPVEEVEAPSLVFITLCHRPTLRFWILVVEVPALLNSPNFHALSASRGEHSLRWPEWSATVSTTVIGPLPLTDPENFMAYAIGNRVLVNTAPMRTYECFPPIRSASADPEPQNSSQNSRNRLIPYRERVHDVPASCSSRKFYFGPHHAVLWDTNPYDVTLSFRIFELHGRGS